MVTSIKTTMVFLFCFLLVKESSGQAYFFENDGFEQWDSSQGYMNPANWYSLNQLTLFGFDATLSRTTDAHSGNFAVKLTSKAKTGLPDLTGVLTTGPFLDGSGNPDFNTIKVKYSYRPTHFQYYYKVDAEQGDSAKIALVLTRWNIANQKEDTIGYAYATYGDSTGTYQFADLTITYDSPLPPDSIFIIASSSGDGFNPMPGSSFYLDDFKIIGGSNGINEIGSDNRSVLYPNPAKGKVILHASKTHADITVYTMQGQMIQQLVNANVETTIDVSAWKPGMYYVCVRDDEGMVERIPLAVN